MADIQKRKGNLLPIQKNGSTDASKSTTKSQNSNWIPPFYKNQYLVEGAELACIHGGGRSVLKVPESHNYYSGDRKKANCKDCVEAENIPYFESCSLNEETCQCQGFMDLEDTWINKNISRLSAELIDEEPAINMSSLLICKKGGIIFPVTSGQGYDGELNEQAFEFRYQNIMRWAGGGQITSIFRGDPVNMNTGNYIYEKEDLRIGGTSPLSFKLFYNAMDCGDQEVLGEGWSHNYGICLKKRNKGELLVIVSGDGREVSFRRTVNSQYLPVMGDRGCIKESNELYFCELDSQKYVFDKDGRMLRQTDADGASRKFRYNAEGLLEYAENENGDFLHYTHNEERHLIFVKDHTGREVSLEYQYGKLRWFTNSSGKTCTYEYNVNGRLQGIITPRGILVGKNEYDGENRVLKQTMPDGGIMEVRYDDENRRTYVREKNGSMISYECDDRARNIRTVYDDGEEFYAYNDRNQKVLFIDKNGNQTRYQYDMQGNLTGIVNALGEKISYVYDQEGRLLTVTAFGKIRKKYEYDEKGRLTRITDVLGRSRKITYDGNNRIRQIVQADGSSYQISYDLKGNVESVEDPYEACTYYRYDALNRVTVHIDAEGNKTQYEYDERDHLTCITNPEGKIRSYSFNESGRPVLVRDFDGKTISAEYDCMNRPERLTDKEGNVIVCKYNRMGKVSEEVSPAGTVTRYQYDGHNRLKRREIIKKAKRSSEICVTEYTYDAVGNLVCMETGNGNEVLSAYTYAYDALNRVTEITDFTGRKTILTYHYSGQISSITDPDGNRRLFNYNDAGELIEETDLRGNVTRYTYNALGLTESVTDGMGRTVRYIYLPGGRLEKILYPNGLFQHFTYDLSGRIKTRTDIYGNCLTFHYDCMGRVVRMTGEAGQEKSFAYGSSGKPVSVKDVTGKITTYEYSPNGNMTAVTDAAGNRSEYAYDEEDRLIRICQYGTEGEIPRETVYERDSLGQIECIRDASGREEYYSFDALGRISEKTDRRGIRTVYFHTPDGKLKRIEYGDGTWTETDYTTSGKSVLIKNPEGEIWIERDRFGKPVKITNASGKSILYEWGNHGEKKSMVYPDGEKVSYLYDENLQLKELIRKAPGRKDVHVLYKRNREGKLTEKIMGGGLRTIWKYNHLGQLSRLIHENHGKILDEYCYEYDAAGNRISLMKKRSGFPDESGKYSFEYDILYRLASVKKDGKVQRTYQYDSFGNRTVSEDEQKGIRICSVYNVLNQLVSEEFQPKRAYRYSGNFYTCRK